MNNLPKAFACLLAAGAVAAILAAPASGQRRQRPAPASLPAQMAPATTSTPATGARSAGADQYFIISSIDLQQHRLVLKQPTEVTLTMLTSEQTTVADENGKPLQLSNLRAGDTIFVTSAAGEAGTMALRIRKGPMTLAELHRRYLKY